MPRLIPQFLQNLKDQAADRIKRELSPEVAEPGPNSVVPDAPDEGTLPQGVLSRMKRYVKNKVQKFSPVQQRMLNPQSPLDPPTIKYRIKYAGENHLLLMMYYNNQWRPVEAYSYRERGRSKMPGGKKRMMFMGYCRIHGVIHSFDPDKIQGLIVTDEVFTPRWPIEVGGVG